MKTHYLSSARVPFARADEFGAIRRLNRHERRRQKVGGGSGGGYTQQNNDDAQAAVLALAQPMIQQVFTTAIAGNNTAQGQVLNIQLNNVGLNTRLTVEVSGTLVRAAAETLNKTEFGLGTFFSNVQLTDLSNYQRVNTPSWHLFMLSSLRRQMAFGAAFVNDSPVNFGSTWPVNVAPACA